MFYAACIVNYSKRGFALTYSPVGFALGTPVRQSSNKFGFALTYSYL